MATYVLVPVVEDVFDVHAGVRAGSGRAGRRAIAELIGMFGVRLSSIVSRHEKRIAEQRAADGQLFRRPIVRLQGVNRFEDGRRRFLMRRNGQIAVRHLSDQSRQIVFVVKNALKIRQIVFVDRYVGDRRLTESKSKFPSKRKTFSSYDFVQRVGKEIFGLFAFLVQIVSSLPLRRSNGRQPDETMDLQNVNFAADNQIVIWNEDRRDLIEQIHVVFGIFRIGCQMIEKVLNVLHRFVLG